MALTRKPDAGVGDEQRKHRSVALAAFLAELATTNDKSTIVFDDPISSLDHMHREAVAKRLVDEAQHRQVVVFTHDIAFLFLLDQAREGVEPSASFRHPLRQPWPRLCGTTNAEPPLKRDR